MKTEDLIFALSADLATAMPSPKRQFAVAIIPGLLAALALFAIMLGPRPDFLVATGDWRFIFKFVTTLLLALCSIILSARLIRPGRSLWAPIAALALVPIVLGAGVITELSLLPRAAWTASMVGRNGTICLISIPLFAAPLLIATLFALRSGAPTRPGITGCVAGLFSGALGAAIYAAHCPDDSPLFVALWYSIAIAVVAIVGLLAGKLTLRW